MAWEMPLLRKSSLLILISLALLLSAENPKPSPIPSPRPTRHQNPQVQQDNKDGTYEHARSKNDSALPKPAEPIQLQQGANQANEYRKVERQLIALEESSDRFNNWLIWIGGINVVAAFLIFGATYQAAKAAKASATAASLALHSNRPYLLVMNVSAKTGQKQPVLGVEEPISSAVIDICNVGSSPADIIEITATPWKYECFPNASEPTWKTLILDTPRDIARSVLGVGQAIKPPIRIVVNWTKDDIELVDSGMKRVALYGIIRYRSAPKELYYTRFFYWFSPLIRPELQKAYSDELNERT